MANINELSEMPLRYSLQFKGSRSRVSALLTVIILRSRFSNDSWDRLQPAAMCTRDEDVRQNLEPDFSAAVPKSPFFELIIVAHVGGSWAPMHKKVLPNPNNALLILA